MTNEEAIHELKMLYNKFRGKDWYGTIREALEMAINALYREENEDELSCIDGTFNERPRGEDVTEWYKYSPLHFSCRP